MPYTSQGYMTNADLDDHRDLTDTGVATYPCDNLPTWLDDATECPRDGHRLDFHDTVTVRHADGEIIGCAR